MQWKQGPLQHLLALAPQMSVFDMASVCLQFFASSFGCNPSLHQDLFISITDLLVVLRLDKHLDDLEINVRTPSGQEPDCLQLRLPGLP